MSEFAITSGFVGIKTSYTVTTETITTGCGCEEVPPPDPNESLMMLYPTKYDVDIKVEGDVPVPLSGGAILKLPGLPDHPKHKENKEDVIKINEIVALFEGDGDLRAALEVVSEELEPWTKEDYDGDPKPQYAQVAKAKKEVNRILINNIAKNPSLVTGYKDLKDLKIRIATTNIDDPSKIQTGEDCGYDLENLKTCFDLTYIPLEAIAGSKSNDQMFGE